MLILVLVSCFSVYYVEALSKSAAKVNVINSTIFCKADVKALQYPQITGNFQELKGHK